MDTMWLCALSLWTEHTAVQWCVDRGSPVHFDTNTDQLIKKGNSVICQPVGTDDEQSPALAYWIYSADRCSSDNTLRVYFSGISFWSCRSSNLNLYEWHPENYEKTVPVDKYQNSPWKISCKKKSTDPVWLAFLQWWSQTIYNSLLVADAPEVTCSQYLDEFILVLILLYSHKPYTRVSSFSLKRFVLLQLWSHFSECLLILFFTDFRWH